jgi:hypothetical protein
MNSMTGFEIRPTWCLGFKKYLDAIEFLRRVAVAAERLNHHPASLRKPSPKAHRPRRRQQDHREAPAAGRGDPECCGGVQRQAGAVAPTPQPHDSVQRRGRITPPHQQGAPLKLSTPPQPTSGDPSSGPDALPRSRRRSLALSPLICRKAPLASRPVCLYRYVVATYL